MDVFKKELILVKTFVGIIWTDTSNFVRNKKIGNNSRNSTRVKCKENHSPWVTTNSFEYCDKNPNTKDPKCCDKRSAKRNKRKDRRSSGNTYGYKSTS